MAKTTKPHRSNAELASREAFKTGKPLPKAPAYLGKLGKECYASVVATLRAMNVDDEADFRAVEAFASAYEEWRTARADCIRDGFTYETYDKNGELRYLKRPEVEVMGDAWKRMRSLLPELYFTPLSRLKGKMPSGQTEDDPFKEFIAEVTPMPARTA